MSLKMQWYKRDEELLFFTSSHSFRFIRQWYIIYYASWFNDQFRDIDISEQSHYGSQRSWIIDQFKIARREL